MPILWPTLRATTGVHCELICVANIRKTRGLFRFLPIKGHSGRVLFPSDFWYLQDWAVTIALHIITHSFLPVVIAMHTVHTYEPQLTHSFHRLQQSYLHNCQTSTQFAGIFVQNACKQSWIYRFLTKYSISLGRCCCCCCLSYKMLR